MSPAQRALVVDDSPRVAQLVRQALEDDGFEVIVASDGESGLETALTEDLDVIVLDVRMLGMDGLEVVRTVREHDIRVPVLILSGRSGVVALVEGLEAGADDYLPKPFAVQELIARVRALVRRGGPDEELTTVDVGDLHMDLARHEVTRGGVPIRLTPREFDLLEALMRHPGTVMSGGRLYASAWGGLPPPDSNIVAVYIGYLRDKIDRPFDRDSIETVRGIGYRLRAPEDRTD